MTPCTLKNALLDCGLDPSVCSEFLKADLKEAKENYDLVKTLLTDKACRKQESLLQQRELLLNALME